MLRYKTVTAVALLGLFLACSSSDDDDDSSGTSTGTATASTGTGTGAGTGTATASTGTGTGTTTGTTTGAATGTATASTGTGTGDVTGSSTGTATASTGTGTGAATGGDLPDGGDRLDVNAPNAEDACAVLSIGAEGKPAILVMVIDKSTSMNENALSTGNQSKWEATRDALIAAIPNLPDTLAVGTVYYPNTSQQGADPQGCEDTSSLIIAPGPMSDPAHEQNLIAGVQAVPNPTTPPGTPTYDAYLIGIQLLQATLANPPPGFEDAVGYVMLATDGMPTHTSNCGPAFGQGNSPRMAVSNAEWQEILDLGSSVADQGINTFVVGVPGSENRNQVPCRDASGQPTLDNSCDENDPAQIDYVPMAKLSELARMGRTAVDGCSDDGPRYCHIDLTGTDDLVIGLQAAIGTIAQSIVSCEYRVPTEQEIQQQAGPNVFPNYEEVAVEYYVGGAATPTSLARSQDGCATGAWQYNADYTQITLCDSMCETVKADPYAAIKINFGCVIPL